MVNWEPPKYNWSKEIIQLEGASLRDLTFPSLPQVLKNPSSSPGGSHGYPSRGAKGDMYEDKSPVTLKLSHILSIANISSTVQLDRPCCVAGIHSSPAKLRPAIVFPMET